MDEIGIEGLSERLHERAEKWPRLYLTQVVLFSAFGYAMYAGVLLGVLALLGGVVALIVLHPNVMLIKFGWKAGVPLVFLVGAMLRALRVQHVDPSGLALTRANAPALFALIDELREKLMVPELDWVLVNDEYNAGVLQIPRFGIFGQRSALMLGLPLLQALSVDDVKAVLAHEFGHLSRNHSRFNGWLYRAVRSYAALVEHTGGNKPLERFLDWYVPRLSAFTFPLRRRNEYEADRASADVVGSARAGQALVNTHVRGSLTPAFWKSVRTEVANTPHPPVRLFQDWESRVTALPPSDAMEALEHALAEKTSATETHPSLADRLRALGVTPTLEAPPQQSAARILLAGQYPYILEQTGFRWSSKVHEEWKTEYQRLQLARQRVAELEQLASERSLNAREAFELADLSEDTRPAMDPLPLFQAALALDEHFPLARLSVGRLLLARNDETGIALMKSLENAPEAGLRLSASALLAQYYERIGDRARAQASIEDAQRAHGELVSRARELERVTVDDRFEPHRLDAESLAALRTDLALFPEIARADLVRKVLPNEDTAWFVLLIELTFKGRSFADDTLSQRVVNALSLPGRLWCLRLDQNPAFKEVIREVPDSSVFNA